jgi:hypothetical protein
LGGLALVVLAAIVFLVPTRDGVIRVEILDPEIEVVIKGTEIVLKQANQGKDVSLLPGHHVLIVRCGELTFETDNLILKKGEMVTVRVAMLAGQIQVRQGKRLIGEKWLPFDGQARRSDRPKPGQPQTLDDAPIDAATRRALDWVFSVDGIVIVQEEGKSPSGHIYKVEELPRTPFEITYIRLPKRSCTDNGLKSLQGLTKLVNLDMKSAGIEGPGLQHLVDLPALTYLNIDDTAVDDDAMAFVAQLKGLKGLSAQSLNITDAGLKHLAGHPQLSWMYLFGTKVSDACVVHLKTIPNLNNVSFRNLPITDAAIVDLAKMEQLVYLDLRDTKITDDGLTQLRSLPHLAHLQVAGTAVTAEAVGHFQSDRKEGGLPKVRVSR